MPGQKPLRLAPGVIAEGNATLKITKHLAECKEMPSTETLEATSTSTPRSTQSNVAVQSPFDHIYPKNLPGSDEEGKLKSKALHLGAPWPSEDSDKTRNEKQQEHVPLRRLKQFLSWSEGMHYVGKALVFLVCAVVVAAVFWHLIWSFVVSQNSDVLSPSTIGRAAQPSSMRFLNNGTSKIVKRTRLDTSMRMFNVTRDVFRVNTSMSMFNATSDVKKVRSSTSANEALSTSANEAHSISTPPSQSDTTRKAEGKPEMVLQLQGLSQELQRVTQHAIHQEHLLPSGSATLVHSDEAQLQNTLDSNKAVFTAQPHRAVLPDHPGIVLARALLEMAVPSWNPKSNRSYSIATLRATAGNIEESSPSTLEVGSKTLLSSSRKVQGLLAPRDVLQ